MSDYYDQFEVVYKPTAVQDRLDAARYRALRDVRSVEGPFISADVQGQIGYLPEGLDVAADRLVRLAENRSKIGVPQDPKLGGTEALAKKELPQIAEPTTK